MWCRLPCWQTLLTRCSLRAFPSRRTSGRSWATASTWKASKLPRNSGKNCTRAISKILILLPHTRHATSMRRCMQIRSVCAQASRFWKCPSSSVIIAVITGSGMLLGESMIDSARRTNTNNKLDAIEAALYAYRMAYNRLPCPGDATLTESSSNYGVEATTKGDCYSVGAIKANGSTSIGSPSLNTPDCRRHHCGLRRPAGKDTESSR